MALPTQVMRARAFGLLRTSVRALRRLRGEWLPVLSDRRDRAAMIASLAVFALLGAPIAQLGTDRCNQCPVTCPMHQHGHDHDGKPTCHGAHSAGVNAATSGDFDCNWSRPPCGHTAVLPTAAIGPMILAEPIRFVPAPLVDPVRSRADHGDTRFRDPPDTPPPISFS